MFPHTTSISRAFGHVYSMKRLVLISVFSFVLSGVFANSAAAADFSLTTLTPPVDSVGVEKKGGKRFILHRVDEGQTLFAIARRYGRSVAEIKTANPDMNEAVRYDQVVRVPIPDGVLSRKEAKAIDKAIRKEEKDEKREVKDTDTAGSTTSKTVAGTGKDVKKADDPARAGIHVVEPGQTVYSLAVRYGVPQADLRRWNNLSSDNVLIGQALIVSEKAYIARIPAAPAPAPKTADIPTRTAPARTGDARPEPARRGDAPRTEKPRTDAPIESKPERTPTASESRRSDTPRNSSATSATKPGEAKPTEVVVESPKAGNDAPMPTRGRRISASGVAEAIDGADGSGKYLALHRTAPIGTLVQVRNAFNNQSVWVKVIGRLPDTGVNDKILIKLSAQAFAKLSPDDRRFRAEVSYIVR